MVVMPKSRAIMALVNPDLLEDLLAGSDREYQESIRQARKDFLRGKTISHEEIFRSN